MKRVLYVGENEQVHAHLKPDWKIGTYLRSTALGVHAVIQEAVLCDCDVVVLESPAVLSEYQMYPEATWRRIKQYATSYMEATGWVVELYHAGELQQKRPA